MDSYEKFLISNELSDFQQSKEWAKVKTLWKNEIITVCDNDKIVLSISILIRRFPFFGYIMYVPRGPVGTIHSENAFKELTAKIKELNKKYKAFVIIVEPNISIDDEKFYNMVKKIGYKINSNAVKFSEEIQARHNFRLVLTGKTEEEVFKNFASKTRYNVRLAIKKSVTVKKMGIKGLDDFYSLMEETGKRDKFIIRPKSYFKEILESFEDKADIYIAYYEGHPVAGILPIIYGNKVTYLYGASSNSYRNVMATYLIQWEIIKLALDRKCDIYDFRGVSMDQGESGGLYRFKKGFGADFIELIGEIYIPFKPVKFKIFKLAKKILYNYRHAVFNIKLKYNK